MREELHGNREKRWGDRKDEKRWGWSWCWWRQHSEHREDLDHRKRSRHRELKCYWHKTVDSYLRLDINMDAMKGELLALLYSQMNSTRYVHIVNVNLLPQHTHISLFTSPTKWYGIISTWYLIDSFNFYTTFMPRLKWKSSFHVFQLCSLFRWYHPRGAALPTRGHLVLRQFSFNFTSLWSREVNGVYLVNPLVFY